MSSSMKVDTEGGTSTGTGMNTGGSISFGKEMRKEFLFAEGHMNLNHGSYGTYPRAVQTTLRSFQDQAEAAPDKFLRYTAKTALNDSRNALSTLLNAPPGNLALVPNATTAINTVLRNLVYPPRSKILIFSTIYGACEKTVLSVCETTPAECLKVEYTYPVPDTFFVTALEDAVARERAAGNEVTVAIFDTIVSLPGVRMPFEALTLACRRLGVLSCIDGAHGVGHLDLDLNALDPDFFVSNCHKWLFVPRGCAVFYVAERCQALMRTSYPTSHGFVPFPPTSDQHGIITATKPTNPMPPPSPPATPFTHQFDYVGTLDLSPYLCIPAALRFRSEICGGESAIRAYCASLARAAGSLAASAFGTEVLENAEGSLGREVFLVNVRLPLDAERIFRLDKEKEGEAGDGQGGAWNGQYQAAMRVVHWMCLRMVRESETFMAILWYKGSWWVRFSATVYLDLRDFEWGVGVLGDLCERVGRGEHLVG